MEDNINPNSISKSEAQKILGSDIVSIAENNSEVTTASDGSISLFGLAALLTRNVLERMDQLKEMEKEKQKGASNAK